MEKLTIEKAQDLCKKYFNKIEDSKERDLMIAHSKTVGDTAVLLAKDSNFDKESMVIAGWIHDIGRTVQKEDHGKVSIDLLENDYELNDIIRDCSINHGRKSVPKTKEGELIKLADKLSLINQDFLKSLIKHNISGEDLDFIIKLLTRAKDMF